MAKRKTVLPTGERRDRSRADDSLLLEYAESLGRMIGALQRELDRATRRVSAKTGTLRSHGASGARQRKPTKQTSTAAARKTAKRPAPRATGKKVKR